MEQRRPEDVLLATFSPYLSAVLGSSRIGPSALFCFVDAWPSDIRWTTRPDQSARQTHCMELAWHTEPYRGVASSLHRRRQSLAPHSCLVARLRGAVLCCHRPHTRVLVAQVLFRTCCRNRWSRCRGDRIWREA